jgi:predicted ester cyclase
LTYFSLLAETLTTSNPNTNQSHEQIEEQVAEGDKVVTRTSGTGTHRGGLFGTAPTGKRVSGEQGIVVTRIANGKVVEDNWVYDALGMLRQLVVVPAPVAKAA